MPAIVRITDEASRARAKHWINCAEPGVTVTFRKPTRSNDQNAKFYAMLTDISRAEPRGLQHTPDVWKSLMMKACGHAVQFVNGIDGEPFPIGFRSSKLTVSQMSELIEFMYQFGAEEGVKWSDEAKKDG